MIWKSLGIIAIGIFAVVFGIRSVGGMEGEAEHLHGGDFVTVTCSASGRAVSGPGAFATSADAACAEARRDQRGRGPWWVAGGLGVTGVGVLMFRRARGK